MVPIPVPIEHIGGACTVHDTRMLLLLLRVALWCANSAIRSVDAIAISLAVAIRVGCSGVALWGSSKRVQVSWAGCCDNILNSVDAGTWIRVLGSLDVVAFSW